MRARIREGIRNVCFRKILRAYKMYDTYRNFQNRFKTLQGEEKTSHHLALFTPFPDNRRAKVMKICLLLEKLAIVFYIIMISILPTSLKH